MVRPILGVIAGYVTMALLVFIFFTALYLALGAEGAFTSGTYTVSLTWIIISCVLSLIAAIAGGFVCAAVSRSSRAVQVLAGLVLVLGILLAIPVLTSSDVRPNVRTGAVPNLEAMAKARTPGWVALLNPVLGTIGVLIGAGLRKNRSVT